jgi:hypothetical protein
MAEILDYPDLPNLDNCVAHCTIGIFGGTEEDIIKNAVEKGCGGPRLKHYVATSKNGSLLGMDGEIACGTAKPIPGLDEAEFSPFDGAPFAGSLHMSQEAVRARRENWTNDGNTTAIALPAAESQYPE